MAQIQKEFWHSLYAAYIDFKMAFNLVDHRTIRLLAASGVPTKIYNLVKPHYIKITQYPKKIYLVIVLFLTKFDFLN